MCRRNQLLGVASIGFGLGLLTAGLFESVFFCGCLAMGTIVAGVLIIRKK